MISRGESRYERTEVMGFSRKCACWYGDNGIKNIIDLNK